MAEFDQDEGDTDEPLEVDLATPRRKNLGGLSENLALHVLDDNFPECTIWREGLELVVQIEERIYTKYWEHKFHGRVFADAMVGAVLRLGGEGHPMGTRKSIPMTLCTFSSVGNQPCPLSLGQRQ